MTETNDAESYWDDIARTWLRDPNREPVDDPNLQAALKRVIQSVDMANDYPEMIAKIKKTAMDAMLLSQMGVDPMLAVNIEDDK